MHTIEYSVEFKKQLDAAIKRKYDIDALKRVIAMQGNEIPLPRKHQNHKLKGAFKNLFDCHSTSDWILIYSKDDSDKIIKLMKTGTSSDLFSNC